MNSQRAVVIIPTYNEKENIEKLIPVLLDVFEKIKTWDMHVLVVDDTSPDHTADVVRAFERQHKNVHLLINKKKGGLGAAYLVGMREAFDQLGADVVFEFDADFSHDPHKISDFLSKIEEGADMVLGSRYIAGGSIPQDWGLYRKFLSTVGNMVNMIVFGNFRIRDWTTGYRAITRRVYEAVHPEMFGERFSGYTFQIGFLHKTLRKGFRIVETPIQFVDRKVGKSKLGPEYIKNTLQYILMARFKEIYAHRIFRFVVVGGTGALVQLTFLQIFRQFLAYQFAFFFSIEVAIVSNFILSNLWTFSDRKLALSQIPLKFIQFNFASAGSIIIQQIVAFIGENFIGLIPLFRVPIIGLVVDTGLVYAVVGILIGMFWNFFAYSRIIWRKTTS